MMNQADRDLLHVVKSLVGDDRYVQGLARSASASHGGYQVTVGNLLDAAGVVEKALTGGNGGLAIKQDHRQEVAELMRKAEAMSDPALREGFTRRADELRRLNGHTGLVPTLMKSFNAAESATGRAGLLAALEDALRTDLPVWLAAHARQHLDRAAGRAQKSTAPAATPEMIYKADRAVAAARTRHGATGLVVKIAGQPDTVLLRKADKQGAVGKADHEHWTEVERLRTLGDKASDPDLRSGYHQLADQLEASIKAPEADDAA